MAPRRPRRVAVTTLAAVAAVAAAATRGTGTCGQPVAAPVATPVATPTPAARASRTPVPVSDHAAYLVAAYVVDPPASTGGGGDGGGGGGGGCPPTAAIRSLDGWADTGPLLEDPGDPGLFASTATLPAAAVRFGGVACGGGAGAAPLAASWSVTPTRGWRSYTFASAEAAGVTACGAAFSFRSVFFDVDEDGERLEVEGAHSRCAYVKAGGGGGGVPSPPPPPVVPGGGAGGNGTVGGGGGGEGGGDGGSGGGSGGGGGVSPTTMPDAPEGLEASPPATDDEPACFPAAATVELADGSVAPLAALPAGAAVRVAAAAHSHVYGWSHRRLGGRHTYVRLSHVPAAAAAAAAAAAGGGAPPAPRHLLLSPGHLLYARGALVPARAVAVGDTLATPGVAGGVSRVVATGTAVAAGKVNPHTLTGDLLVDGVRVSTYTDALHPAVAHALLAPARAAFRWGLSAEPMGRLLYGGVPGWGRWRA